jgi:hypothetical protein
VITLKIMRVRGEVVDKPRRRQDGLEEGSDSYQFRENSILKLRGGINDD